MRVRDWNIEAETGYKPMTTFYQDFSIADWFGRSAVVDTFKRAFHEWRENYLYLTELVLALNWKIWEHYQSNRILAGVYNDLWEQASEYAENELEGDELRYYYTTTD